MPALSLLLKTGILIAVGLAVASFVLSIWTAGAGGNFGQVALAALFLCVALSMWWQR
jgi:hypothetical protein